MTIYEDNAPNVLGAVVTMLVLSLVSFGLRVHVRYGQKMWGLEDWAMTIALPLYLVLSISCILGSVNGIGVKDTHIKAAGEDYERIGLMYFFLFEVFYCASIIPVKLSISLMLIRIAQNRKPYIWASWGMMLLFFLADGGAMFYIIFQCSPVSYAWNTNQVGSCLPSVWLADVYYMTTAVNIATDWSTAILPIPLLWHVRLDRSEKISVAGILGLGIFASLAACIRLNYTINLTSSTNYLYAISKVLTWGYLEVAVGFFVGCIATLRPLFRQMFRLGSLGSSKSKSRTGGASSTPFPTNSRRTYDQFSRRDDRGFEMGDIGTTSKAYKGPARPPSTPSDSESMEKMLIENNQKKDGGMGNQSIVVSRQVRIETSPK